MLHDIQVSLISQKALLLHFSSVRKRDKPSPDECSQERYPKRICCIEIPNRRLDQLGAVEAIVIDDEKIRQSEFVDPQKSAPRKLECSTLDAEANDFPSLAPTTNTSPTEVRFDISGTHAETLFPPESRHFWPTPLPFSCAIQTLVNPSTPFPDATDENGGQSRNQWYQTKASEELLRQDVRASSFRKSSNARMPSWVATSLAPGKTLWNSTANVASPLLTC